MSKRKEAPAASSSSLPPRKSSKNVEDRSASGKGFPTAFMIVVDALSKISEESFNYIYQVSLRPGLELYSSIGTFSHLFSLDESETFKVLKGAGLVGVEGIQRKPIFKNNNGMRSETASPDFSGTNTVKTRLSFSDWARARWQAKSRPSRHRHNSAALIFFTKNSRQN